MSIIKNLQDRFGLEVEGGDEIEFKSPYADSNIVDVIITDGRTGEKFVYEAYDLKRHCFPYW